jgi:hypothetical protein
MHENLMSVGIQTSSTCGLEASSSVVQCQSSQPTTEKHDDLENAKLIPSIPPLVGVVSHESVPRDFDYTLITAYLSKGIRAAGP